MGKEERGKRSKEGKEGRSQRERGKGRDPKGKDDLTCEKIKIFASGDFAISLLTYWIAVASLVPCLWTKSESSSSLNEEITPF